MRVFDFDGTIYDGESLFDLYRVGKLCHGYLSELAESVEFEELVTPSGIRT